jgi:hypothetical protein
VSLRVGGVTLLNRNAVGVVGAYAQVDAGTVAVGLGVNGAAVTVPNQTLTAGGDYTLLIWSNTDGTQITLISDDNRLPSSASKAKLRIMNGLSTQNVPVTLLVNFFPQVENVALGQASAFSEADEGTDYQLDVSNTDTAEPLLTKTGVTLQAAGVYTLFMSASSGTISGTLRKDR